jgi:hypothetical protein
MRRLTVTILALTLAAAAAPTAGHGQGLADRPPAQSTPATTIADTVPPPPGVPNLAWLSSIEGVPGDAADRRAFMSGFRGAFAEGAYATERERGGRPVASIPVSARFRLIEGTGGWGVWNVHVVVAWSEPQAAPRGAAARGPTLELTVAALSPEAVEQGARPIPARVTLALEPAATRAESMRAAGRATALVALDRLHHLSGDLDEDTHLALGPARRVTR